MAKSEAGIDNRIFSAIVAIVGMGLFALWFFLHPNSPWHGRNVYVVRFAEIGTLVEGNTVLVNGISQGKVVGSELTDSCVWVKLQVLSEVAIPEDSRFKIVNSGLMGERAVGVSLGSADRLLANGDTISGGIDLGSTRLGMLAMDCLREIEGLVTTGGAVLDSLTDSTNSARLVRMERKGIKLSRKFRETQQAVQDSIVILSQGLADIKARSKELSAELAPGVHTAADSLAALEKRIEALREPLQKVGASADAIIRKLDSKDSDLGLLVNDTAIRNRLHSLSQNAQSLMERMDKKGLDLNVDIW